VTRHILWQALLAVLGIVLVFVVLFQLASTAPPQVEMVEVPAEGGTYIEGLLGYVDTINPILTPSFVQANPVEQDLTALVFDGLLDIDQSGQILPALATDWQISKDGSVYEFHLRKDVTWHDGAPFTAADVAFTIQAMQDPNYQGPEALRELWHNVTVEVVDSHTVRFTLHEPFPSFLYYATIGILPAHLLSAVPAADLLEHKFSRREPVGTGMFQVESMAPDRVVLKTYPGYWRQTPFLDKVEFWLFGSEEDLLAAYEAGEIQGFHPGHPGEISALARFPGLQLYSAPATGYGAIILNLAKGDLAFLQEKEVRQALLYGLDRQALIDQLMDGQALVAHSPIPPFLWAYDPTVRQYGYDPERAIGLLDASGWLDSNGDRIRDKDGVTLAFTLVVSDDPTAVQWAQEIARQWAAIGVDVSIRSTTSNAVATLVRRRDFDAALIDIAMTADPDPYPLWHSTQVGEGGQNFSGFANEDADVVMEEIRTTPDPERLVELYHTFQQIFAKDVPALLLYHPVYVYAVDEQVHQVQISPMVYTSQRFRNVADWYMLTKKIEASAEDTLDKSGE